MLVSKILIFILNILFIMQYHLIYLNYEQPLLFHHNFQTTFQFILPQKFLIKINRNQVLLIILIYHIFKLVYYFMQMY